MTEHTDREIRLFDEVAAAYVEVLPFFQGFAELHFEARVRAGLDLTLPSPPAAVS